MPVILTIDPRSGIPLYLQIIEQIKRSIAVGALVESEQLPTVKSLALELTINPNTVAKAYRDLERDGVIETAPGRGSFVRANGASRPAQAASDVARDALSLAVREAKSVGLDRGRVREIFDETLQRWYPEES